MMEQYRIYEYLIEKTVQYKKPKPFHRFEPYIDGWL